MTDINDPQVVLNPSHSPLFGLLNADRYQRQSRIREVEAITNRRLIVYFTNTQSIEQVDVAPFQELLLDCDADCDIDLFMQSPGGDIDVAEKLVYMLRDRAKSFRFIVAERAKSAATMMALASDEILMSATSELGPIDPQITFSNAAGTMVSRPARSFLDGLEDIKKEVAADPNRALNPAYYPLLSQLDTALIDFCNKAIARAEQFAEKWLVRYMLSADTSKAKTIASSLVDVEKYSSHGMVIDHEEATALGLKIKFMPVDDPLWLKIWQLYLSYEVAGMKGANKLFESRKISLIL